VRRAFFCICILACAALMRLPAATAQGHETPWMSEEAMRADFVGTTLRGYYRDGGPWVASYDGGGRYDVREGELQAVGNWYFRGRAFCFLYGPPAWPLEERCVATVKVSANCYEFHLVWPDPRVPGDAKSFQPQRRWHSRGWRPKEPSTCEPVPIV
jgi:hypothetical protein